MKKFVIIILGTLIGSGTLLSQNFNISVTPDHEELIKKADSLEQKLGLTPDSLQWALLNELGKTYARFPRKDTLALQKGKILSLQAERLAISETDTSRWIQSLDRVIFFYKRTKEGKEKIEKLEAQRRILSVHQGYTISKNYNLWDGNKENSLDRRLWVYYDSSSTLGLNDIRAFHLGDQMKPYSRGGRDMNDYPGSWWLRFRLKSQAYHGVEHVFYTGGDRKFWDTVEVYVPLANGEYEKHLTGLGLDRKAWEVPDRANHFRISVPPHQDMSVFMRLKGFDPGFAPDRIRVRHINYEAFLREKVKTHHANGIFQGVVFIQLFFFLLLFLATRDPIYGNYVIYILGLCLFIVMVNYFYDLDNMVELGLYLLAIWLSTVGMLRFSYVYLNMKQLMPKWKKWVRIILITFTGVSISNGVIIPFLDGQFGKVLGIILAISGLLYFLILLASAVFLIIWGIQTYRRGYAPAKYYLIATLFLFLGFLMPLGLVPFEENLEEMGFFEYISLNNVIEGGIALQLCLFALGVGHKRNLLEKERKDALEKNLALQKEINTATDRFVPYEFLKTLGRESILDVHLGDHVEKNVTVFFSDIRDYTSLSEKLTPQQNFLFLNNYLGRVGPIIKTNRGFVNQYYGDGIMALFMDADSGINSPRDSVLAAIEMHQELYEYNEERIEKGRDPLRIGIGIHTGPLMLGVIGDEKRMDVGVVSDAVNTAARMEGLTKYYGATTIVSGATFDGISHTDGMNYRYLGQVLVKGKMEPIRIYDFFDGDSENIGIKKENSLQSFQQGLAAYFEKDFQAAIKIFSEILSTFPEDKASKSYLSKSQAYLQTGVPDDWMGVELIGGK